MLHRIICLLVVLLMGFNLKAQDIEEPVTIYAVNGDVNLSKKNRANLPLLISKLAPTTADEKSKFDAIFYWVANNIKYSISNFYAPINSNPEQIADILKDRKTICLGYAQLMDTLCRLAGIQNVVVYGYAKDEFYDVNDTIYGHNHAWNAVKLNGLWYLYDVTWSTGITETYYTRSAKWVLKMRERFSPKFKKKRVGLPKKFRRSECDEKLSNVYYYKQRFFNRWIRKWLYRLPVNYYWKYKKKIRADYYLSNPEIFAATHVPDDPIWSLLDRKLCSEFERDSLFYYLNDSLLSNQKRIGKECVLCDSIYVSDVKNRFIIRKWLIKQLLLQLYIPIRSGSLNAFVLLLIQKRLNLILQNEFLI